MNKRFSKIQEETIFIEIPQTKVAKIPKSMFNIERNRFFLTFIVILSFAIAAFVSGFYLFNTNLAYVKSTSVNVSFVFGIILIILGLGICIPFLIRKSYLRKTSADFRNIKTYRANNMLPEIIDMVKDINGEIFPTKTFINYGYWRIRLLMGVLFDAPSKETILILREFYEANDDLKIRKKAAHYLDILAVKYNLRTREELFNSLDKIKFDVEQPKQEYQIMGIDEFPNFDSLLKPYHYAILIVTSIILPPFILPFTIWYLLVKRKIRKLMVNNDLETLRNYIQTKGNIKGYMAVIALADIGTPEDLPLLQYKRQKAVDAQSKAYVKEVIISIKKRYNIQSE